MKQKHVFLICIEKFLNEHLKIRLTCIILLIALINVHASSNVDKALTAGIEKVVQKTISGQTLDATGQPLPGVNIKEKGASNGAVSDFDGNYSIKVTSSNPVLVFSYLGFKTQEVVVGDKSSYTVTMIEDASQLDEVVVVGYGSVRKKDLTGAVAQVKGDVLENLPSSRVDQLLQGRMTGVNVTSTSGSPGARASIRIRGGNSITGNNEPLYVVDGYIAGQDFDLNTVNVNDIKSIEVLKDASSLAIYGTRGANGVILITTKSGDGVAESKPSISINYYSGVQSALNQIDYITGDEFIAYRNDAGDTFYNNPVFNGNTDWFDVVTQTGETSNVDFSVRGNSEKVSYYFSANAFEQTGIVKYSGIERYALRTNIDVKVSDKLKVGTKSNVAFQKRDADRIGIRSLNFALPIYPVFNDDGSYFAEPLPSGDPYFNVVSALENRTVTVHSTEFISTLYLQWEPIKSLVFKSSIAPRVRWQNSLRYDPIALTNGQDIGSGSVTNLYTREILQENTLSYVPDLGEDHSLNLLGGFTWQTSESERIGAAGSGITTDLLGVYALNVSSQDTRTVSAAYSNPFQLVSWLARVNYSFKDKYLLTLTGRVDGSSRFATSDNPYAFFPAAAFAWNAKKESFLEDVDFLHDLKLRASYGASGSQSIPSFSALSIYGGAGPVSFNDTRVQATAVSRPANPDLQWETTTQLDFGLEAAFFNNRLSFEVDWYRKETNDLLVQVPLSAQSGFSDPVLKNIGSIENQGVEFALDGVIVDNEDFRWQSTITVSSNKSKVLALAEDERIPSTGFIGANLGTASVIEVGQPVGVFTGLQYLGLWQTQQEIDDAGWTGLAQPGDPRFLDVNDDQAYTFEDDYQVIGNPEPDIYFGWNNNISYKNFSLDFMFQGTIGNDVYNVNTAYSFFDLGGASNLYPDVLNRWTPTNTNTNVPRAAYTPAFLESNSELVEDGSHVRLRSLRFGYSFDEDIIKFAKSLNVYVSGTNLFLITAKGFRGIDPEANDTFDSRSLGQVNRGFISNAYPSSSAITLGVNLTF